VLADLGERQPPGHQVPSDAGDAAQVGQGRRDDVDARVRVVDPVDGNLVDAQPGALGEHEQFGVEEPAGVGHEREQLAGGVGPDGLEAALRVREPREQRAAQHQVVAARDDLALGAAHDPRGPAQPGPDRQVRVARDERRDERQQCGQVGRQVDVEVGEHVGVRVQPRAVQRPAAPLRGQVQDAHARELRGQPVRDVEGAVGRGVVGDGHPRRVREGLVQEGPHGPHGALEARGLVVYRDHEVQDWAPRPVGLDSRVW
jgi:hypothetical protein